MLIRSVRTVGTCSLVEMSFFALSHMPPVLLMDVGSWTLATKTRTRHLSKHKFCNQRTEDHQRSDANRPFKEDFYGDQNALVIIKLCTSIGDAMEIIGAQ